MPKPVLLLNNCRDISTHTQPWIRENNCIANLNKIGKIRRKVITTPILYEPESSYY